MKWNFNILIAVTVLLFTACDAGVQSTQTIPLPMQTETSSGAYQASCVFNPIPIPRNEYVTMTLTLQRADGADLSPELAIKVDADMPSHGHGINTEPEIKKLSDGKYEVKGLLFHMGGDWELYIDVIEDDIPDRATIPFNL